MRVIAFFVYVFIHLFGGADHMATDNSQHHAHHALTQILANDLQDKYTSYNHVVTTIDDADLDLDEDVSSNNAKAESSNKLPVGKSNFTNSWYIAFSSPSILNHYSKSFKSFPPFCGYSSPVYIRQRVLRI
jgi:hypothetical protein